MGCFRTNPLNMKWKAELKIISHENSGIKNVGGFREDQRKIFSESCLPDTAERIIT